MTKIPARTGVQWLKDGLRLFTRQPGGLLAILFVTMLFGMLLAAIAIGPILLPTLIVIIMQACQQADQGQRITPRVLLTGFRGPEFKVLCKLGLVHMGISLLLTLLAVSLVDPKLIKLIESGPMDAKAAAQINPSDVYTMLAICFVQLLIWLGMIYAAPLIYWQKMKVFKSIFYSVVAVWREGKAFAMMLLTWFGAFFALSVLTALIAGPNNIGRTFMMWVGSLCVVILWCALYIGYRQIFGATHQVDTIA